VEIGDQTKRLAARGVETGRRGRERIGSTEPGARTGTAVRAVLGELARLPIVTAVGDAVRAKNTIRPLLEAVRRQPDDPWANLHAGEALRAAEQDMGWYVRFRTVTDPSSVLVRLALRSAVALGRDRPEEAGAQHRVDGAEVLLRRAYALALGRTRADATDLDAFHVIGRIFLAQAMPGAAYRALHTGFRQAVAGGAPPDPAALVTLARASLALGRLDEARSHAAAAIGLGCSVGNEVLADLVFDDSATSTSTSSSTRSRISRFTTLMERVTDDDRAAYYGTNRSASSVLRTFQAEQWSKTTSTVSRGLATGRRSVATARGLSPSLGRLLDDRGRGAAAAIRTASADSADRQTDPQDKEHTT
jgi:hypothetical protein